MHHTHHNPTAGDPMNTTASATTLADELRTVAAGLREAAKEATRGPWVPYPTITADQHDEAWTISRTWCDKQPCEPDCGHTVLTTGAEGCEEDNIRFGDVAWICLTNPLLAEPLAAWLEDTATWWDNTTAYGPDGDTTLYHATPECGHEADGCGCFHRARDVAHAINGGAA
jgi:hypothetical protein